MTTKVVRPAASDVELWTERLGEPDSPALLLIMGANAAAPTWPDEWIALLTAGGLQVIRYDQRDTGRSTQTDPATATYDVGDLAADAVAVLDAYGLVAAHVMGMSLGGLVAQVMAIRYPARVRTLIPIMTGALDLGTDEGVPMPGAEELAPMLELFEPKPDRESELERRVAFWRLMHGGELPFDAAEFRTIEERVIEHSGTIVPSTGHFRLGELPLPYGGADLARITAPTLAVQGTADPLYAPPHAAHLAELVPDGKVLELAGCGHALPASVHRELADAVLGHTLTNGHQNG